MNIIKRLRNRETTNTHQAFAYTATMLESTMGQPDIVVPIREVIQPTTISRLLGETGYFFQRHDLPLIFGFDKIKLFQIKNDNFKHNSRYILIYGYKNKKDNLTFNDSHKNDFKTDLLLQVGTKCERRSTTI